MQSGHRHSFFELSLFNLNVGLMLFPGKLLASGNNHETRKREVLVRMEAFFECFLGSI